MSVSSRDGAMAHPITHLESRSSTTERREPSFIRPRGQNITRPLLMRTPRCKILIQEVRGHTCSWLTFRGSPMPPTASRQALFSHQMSHSCLGSGKSRGQQFVVDPWTPTCPPIHLPTPTVSILECTRPTGSLHVRADSAVAPSTR